jgi:two-component system, NtrC family, sensor kinase
MSRRSKGGSGRAKVGRRNATPSRLRTGRKTARNNPATADNQETLVARLKRELNELRKQQSATSEVLQLISPSVSGLEAIFAAILEKAVTICEADFGNIYQWDREVLHLVASHNAPPAFVEYRRRSPVIAGTSPSASVPGRMAANRTAIHIADLAKDKAYIDRNLQTVAAVELGGTRTLVAAPMINGDKLIGSISLARQVVRPFNAAQIALLTNFAAQAVIAIENARLFDEVQAKTSDLEESLQQQTAAADVLKVIGRSAFDLNQVFETVVESSVRLCGADRAIIFRFDGQMLRVAMVYHAPDNLKAWLEQNPIRPGRYSVAARAALERRTVQVDDVRADPDHTYAAKEIEPFRTVLGVPMLKGDDLLGVILVYHNEIRPFTEKQILLVSTFAEQAAIAIENVRLFDEVQARTRELAKSLENLRKAQDRLIQTEKLASLGQLTAGIAHEIKNPLNFVNNFSALSVELIDELNDLLKSATLDDNVRKEVDELTRLLKDNLGKVAQHGSRADSIVKNMLLHSREGSGERRSADINTLVAESLDLAYHGARAAKVDFNMTLKHDLDPDAGTLDLYPQEMTRALLNLISNGFYAATRRKLQSGDETFEPILRAATRNLGKTIQIRIRDNGTGIPADIREKIFNPFFTTKPTGEGTGLGLSMTYDIIVKQHGGTIEVEAKPGEFTEFIITLPRDDGTAVGEKLK